VSRSSSPSSRGRLTATAVRPGLEAAGAGRGGGPAAAANTAVTHVRLREGSNTRITRTKRHYPAHVGTPAKMASQAPDRPIAGKAGCGAVLGRGSRADDRPSEKRKVDSSILSLTTHLDQAICPVTCEVATLRDRVASAACGRFRLFVTALHRWLLHVECTPDQRRFTVKSRLTYADVRRSSVCPFFR